MASILMELGNAGPGEVDMHGWYRRKKGDSPVSVTVKAIGLNKYLFQPKGA
ncbi:hypothetical protein [Sphingobium sp. B2]|uniref:hypothetical protein n=1 Tax=Sphingobium sp. B2 TaxID=2583228 RepID=UPI001643EA86|nr:hypothetical protein [Sphingobium sp. B2]